MTINSYLEEFAGKKVTDWQPADEIDSPAGKAYKISLEYDDDESWPDRFAAFLETPGAENVEAFIVGSWGTMAEGDTSAEIVEAIAAACQQLKKLEAIFIADVTFEDCEISWITQSDMSAIFAAYPNLRFFGVRGGTELALGSLKHDCLESLVVETGGLDQSIVQQVAKSQLPKLKHLELWLGDTGYGATFDLEDLAPIINGEIFPSLEYLGLRDSEMADALARELAASPVLNRLKVLDLSLGVLSDAGAEALLSSAGIKKLQKLDIHHHYCSDETIDKLLALGIEVDVSGAEGDVPARDRYVAVGE